MIDEGFRGIPDGRGYSAQGYEGSGVPEINKDEHGMLSAEVQAQQAQVSEESSEASLSSEAYAAAKVAGQLIGGQVRESGSNAVNRLLSRKNRGGNDAPSPAEIAAIVAVSSLVSLYEKAEKIIKRG